MMQDEFTRLGQRLLDYKNGTLTSGAMRREIDAARHAIEVQRMCDAVAKGCRGAEFYARLGKLRHALDALHQVLTRDRWFSGGDGI